MRNGWVLVLAVAGMPGLACDGGTQLGGDGGADGDGATGDAEPPIPDIGGPGWRDSVEPWLPPPRGIIECRSDAYVFDLWADESGLYILDAVQPGSAEGRLTVSANHGSGWAEFFSGSTPCGAPGVLCGSIGGHLLAAPGLLDIGPGSVTPWLDCPTSHVPDAFIVNDGLGYALVGDGGYPPRTQVLAFDGTAWLPAAAGPIPIDGLLRLWADEDDLYVAGLGGVLVSREGDGWLIHDVGTVSAIVSLWGFEGDDVWAGSADGGLFHFDGSAWSDVPWPDLVDPANRCDADPHVAQGLWGADGVLYIRSDDAIVRRDGDFTVIAHWSRSNRTICQSDGVQIWRVRGISPDEVFVMAEGPVVDPTGSGCRTPFVLYWDGAAFHRM